MLFHHDIIVFPCEEDGVGAIGLWVTDDVNQMALLVVIVRGFRGHAPVGAVSKEGDASSLVEGVSEVSRFRSTFLLCLYDLSLSIGDVGR